MDLCNELRVEVGLEISRKLVVSVWSKRTPYSQHVHGGRAVQSPRAHKVRILPAESVSVCLYLPPYPRPPQVQTGWIQGPIDITVTLQAGEPLTGEHWPIASHNFTFYGHGVLVKMS